MRYVQLRAFHYVAVHGGFSRAADKLNLTQPAISDPVRKLEAEYDIRLFYRQKKQVQLTETGKVLLDLTHRLFDVENQALEFLSKSLTEHAGTLRIIADSAHHMTQVLAQFRRKFPDVFVSVSSGNSDQVVEQLKRYEADIGVLGNLPDARNHEVVKLDSSPIVAFAPVDSAYARETSVSMKQLADWPLVLRENGSRTRSQLEKQAAVAGVVVTASIEAEGREAVRLIVADGGGVGVVSEAEFGQHQGLAKIRINDMQLTMDESIICLRERRHSKLIQGFMEFARESVHSSAKSRRVIE